MFRTITPILAIAVALFIYFFFTQPLFTEIAIVNAEIAKYTEALEKAEEKNALLQDLLRKKNSYSEENLRRLNALVPENVDELRLLVDLTELASKHSMLIGNVKVDPDEAKTVSVNAQQSSNGAVDINSVSYATITFGLIGTYEQFKNMLRDMEQSLVLMEVTSISFTPSEGMFQQFEVSVRAYALLR